VKRIVFIIHSLHAGGMERVVSVLSNNFANCEDSDVHIILIGKKRDVFYNINKAITIHKPNFKFNNKNRFFSTFKTLLFLRETIKMLEPNTVLSFGEYWNNLVLIASFGLKIPVYIADRSEPMKDLGKIQNNLRKLLYSRAKGLILQTQQAKEIYEKYFKNINIEVIGNPIGGIESNENVKRENILLMVSRLITTKHHDRLIRIFSKINNRNWKLVFVGDDAKKQKNKIKLTKLVKELEFENNVFLVGKTTDVESYYLKSKIFVFTSSSEGFPNVIGEAMSAGLPVVSYDCIGGPSEIITNMEDGYIIPLFDDKMFQSKLEQIMNDETLRINMGVKAKNNIKRFDTNLIAAKFLEFMLSHEKL